MSILNPSHHSKIEKQSLHDLIKGYAMLCEMEFEHESKLKVIQEVKIRIMLEIEIKQNNNHK